MQRLLFTKLGLIVVRLFCFTIVGFCTLFLSSAPQTYAFAVLPSADLSLTLTAPSTSGPVGSEVTITLTITNDGPGDAADVAVSIPFSSPQLDLQSSSGDGSYNPVSGALTFTTITNGASVSQTFDIEFADTGTTTITAEIMSADNTDPDSTFGDGIDQDDMKTLDFTITSSGPGPSGTFLFHLYTDTNGNGSQDLGEPDGNDDTVITLNDGSVDTDIATDSNGDINSSIGIGSYTITLSPPSGGQVTGGVNPFSFVVTTGATTDTGSRGIYDSGSSGTGSFLGGSGSGRRNDSGFHSPISAEIDEKPLCLAIGSGKKFSDISTPTADFNYVTSLVSANDSAEYLLRGYASGEFKPNKHLSRFELLKIAMMSNCVGGNTFSVPNTHFSDVPKDDSIQSRIVGEAFKRGVIQGINNQFYPDNPVTFAEMIKMLFATSFYFKNGEPLSQLEITIPNFNNSVFAQFMEHAYRLDILPITFSPDQPVSRGEMVNVLARYIHHIEGSIVKDPE
ncbi:MAG: S-layer homology domain-containing protein [Candidatus Abawacabacteria bacterium]|nr:S-layer homology domain-containing protein [Candidatus Abawacabacteria bacterium]